MYVGHENTKRGYTELEASLSYMTETERERGRESVIVWERMKSKAREWRKSIVICVCLHINIIEAEVGTIWREVASNKRREWIGRALRYE